MSELLPCPFCGSDDLVVQSNTWAHGPSYRVRCSEGHALDWWHTTAAEAVTAWNGRAAPSPGDGELRGVIEWALGCGDDFPERKEGDGLYWWRKELTKRYHAALGKPAQVAPDALREAIRARMRLYDSQIDPDCIGTGYDVTDIITISELEQLVGFKRAALGAPRNG